MIPVSPDVSLNFEKAYMGNHVGINSDFDISLQVFYADPLVVPVPTIKSHNGIPIPVNSLVQKYWSLASFATSIGYHANASFLDLYISFNSLLN